MNKFKKPSIYALTEPDGGFFYVGRTKLNSQNRLWEHIYRARINHSAPVYQKMNQVGVSNVTVIDLEYLSDDQDARMVEAWWIKSLIGSGYDIVNALARDGVPDSWSREMRERGMLSRRGIPTWIKGKKGEEAGWTQERRLAQSMARKSARVRKHGTKLERKKYGCQCPECINWETQYLADRESKKKMNIHGTVASYKNGLCRCEECTMATRIYKRSLREKPVS